MASQLQVANADTKRRSLLSHPPLREVDDVSVFVNIEGPQYFDSHFKTMQTTHADDGVDEWRFCYQRQVQVLESYLRPGMTILDVGCGPSLPYSPPLNCGVIGLEMSIQSLLANQELQLKLLASAAEIPLLDESVDAVVCFYSVHHMIQNSVAANYTLRARAFTEFCRVLKPGGTLFVFEMIPIAPCFSIQNIIWNTAKRLMGSKLDMHFCSSSLLESLGRTAMPDAAPEKLYFDNSLFSVFPPCLAFPKLRVYRFMYPLSPKLFRWKKPCNDQLSIRAAECDE